MESTRKRFEDIAFNRRFICGIKRVGNGQFPFQVDCPPQDEFVRRDENGEYLDETLQIMWWAWCKAMEEASKLKLFFADFHGLFIGGNAVVMAENADRAHALVRHKMDEHGLDHRDLAKEEVVEIDMTFEGVKEFYNGDY